MKKLLLSIFIIILPLLAKANNLEGKYRCVEYSKKTLPSMLTISKTPTVYKLHWVYPDNTVVDGEGILQGNKIAVMYEDAEKGLRYGVESIEVNDEDNTLKGVFSYYDSEEKGVETCQKLVTE